jgi:triacylglycerol lipase
VWNLTKQSSLSERARSLGHITWSTLHDDPWETRSELRSAFTSVSTFEADAQWGMVASNDDVAVLTFRGTDSNLEWAHSLTFKQVAWFEGKAHGGFVKALDTVWDLVLAAMFDERVLEDGKTLWVSGHSLGGALALLAADRLARLGFDVEEVFTFGTPCVFDAIAANAFTIPVYRVVNNEDPVPKFSWPTLFDEYTCFGEEVFLLASGAVAKSRHSHHLARKIDRANSIGEGILEAGLINDHFMREYARKLDLWVVEESRSGESTPSSP